MPELARHGAQQRRLAGAGRALQEHVAVGREGSDDEIDLASPARRPGSSSAVDEFVVFTRSIGRQSNMMTPRMFSPLRIAS